MPVLKYDAGIGKQKNWLIQEQIFDERNLGKFEAIFTQGNGYLGIRNSLEERYVGEVRNTFITGTFNKASANEVTELPNVADMTGINIFIDGYEVNLSKGKLKNYSRTMNLKNGEVIRTFVWENQMGTTITASFRRIVSLADEHVMAAAVDLTADRPVEMVIETGIDGSVSNSGSQHFEEILRRIYDGRDMQYLAKTTQSDVWVAQHAACKLNVEAEIIPIMERRTLKNRYHFKLQEKNNFHLEKISVYHSSRDKKYEGVQNDSVLSNLKEDGIRVLHEAFEKGYKVIKEESQAKWKNYWDKNDIVIEGDADFEQLAIRFALYHLNIMVKHDDNRVGIGAKALTGEGYKGHSFWDTEMFILPYYIFTKPDTAKTLLEYRYRNLLGARSKAKEYGYEGAMYPWESAWVDDGEVTPSHLGADVITGEITKVWTGIIEHHISADIAYAVEQYYLVTKDEQYMEECGYEIILDTALFWASRVQYNQQKDCYEILDVIGPDEYQEHVDNNAYTNYMAAYNMKLALQIIDTLCVKNTQLYHKLEQKLPLNHIRTKIEQCMDKLYLPQPNEEGIIPQFDGYFDLKKMDLSEYKNSDEVMTIFKKYNTEQLGQYMVCKQADTVMLLFVLDTLFDKETKRKNFMFYEDKTLHDSSLSKCIHAILACDLGLDKMAYDFYEKALRIDLGSQMASSNEGIHSASTGGIWESTIMGFGGVRMQGECMRIAPRLPERWTCLKFSLIYQGCPLQIIAKKDKVIVTNQGTRDIELLLGKEYILLTPQEEVTKNL